MSDMDDIKRGIEQQFRWAVQALVQASDVQPTLFPPFVVVADELALDFDNYRRAYEDHFGEFWSSAERQAIEALDHQLNRMSGDKPHLWSDDGCLNHPQWAEVRRLAHQVLSEFGWLAD